MPAERLGSAGLCRRHHPELAETDMSGIGPSPCEAMGAENVSNLQLCLGQPVAVYFGPCLAACSFSFSRASNGLTVSRIVLVATCVHRGRAQAGVTRQNPDDPDVGVRIQ